MSERKLHVTIRTPHETVVDQDASAVRIPTHTGQVGLRPRGEPSVLAVEPGLIVLRIDGHRQYVGTAGGLLHANGKSASLLTPLAVTGESLEAVSQRLEQRLSAPNEELEVRRMLGRLEKRIVQEARQSDDDLRGQGSPH